MSLGWKKFSFFEREETDVSLPEDCCCCSGSSTTIFCGVSSGRIVVVDRGSSDQREFNAHQGRVLKLVFLEERGLLVSLGQEPVSCFLKVWKIEVWAKSAEAPPLLRAIDAFAGKLADAQVTEMTVHASSWPQLTYAVGLSSGLVHVLKADTGKDRVARTELSARPDNSDLWQVTGLGFSAAENSLHLYVETVSQTLSFNIATSRKSVLDEMGAEAGCTTMNHEAELVIARPEAVYLYTLDGRGPCFVFDGQKRHVGWVRHYLTAVTSGQASSLASSGPSLQIFDLRNKLIATSLPLGEEPQRVLSAWGMVLVVQADGRLLCLKEKPLQAKLELLYAKGLYLVALNLAHSEQADAAAVAEIQRRYADHLYSKHDHDAAMTQYLATIGFLEPSFVIRKFLDAQRIHNLTAYLEALHAKGLASSDHTTLLLNCYTKLKDVEKLDEFLKSSGATEDVPHLRFDAETAIKVCRAAGYFEHALYVAQAAEQPAVYLDVLVEDCRSWDEALAHLQSLPRHAAAAALQQYGKVLVTQRPEATTALLMQLCTAAEADAEETWVAQVADYTHLYDERPQALMLLCEFILNSTRSPPSEAALYHTLLQLYLATEAEARRAEQDDSGPSNSPAARREQALELLKRGWQPGSEPHYNADQVLVLCRTHNFREGLIFLYEKLRLFREVLRVFMAAGDHSGVIEACIRLGDASRGGEPHLWTDVLEYLAQQDSDVTVQIQEVLGHIEAGNLLPPLVVLQTLAKNPQLRVGLVKEYLARQLRAETEHIEEDRRQIARYEEETLAMREQVHELKTKPRIFQNSKCAVSGAPLELPAVHFLCGHSCNLRSLGENERECPLCAPHFRTILDIRRSLKASATDQDKFFTQLRSSGDGFSVIAEFFGRGLLNNTSAARSSQ